MVQCASHERGHPDQPRCQGNVCCGKGMTTDDMEANVGYVAVVEVSVTTDPEKILQL